MKKWNDLTQLALLDDADAKSADLPSRAWEDLTLKAAKAQAAPKIVNNAATNPVAQKAAAARGKNKIFSSKPTLRDMMRDYNRRSAPPSPIKMNNTAAAPDDFNFQEVDLINIPIIPGKILRPSTGEDADS